MILLPLAATLPSPPRQTLTISTTVSPSRFLHHAVVRHSSSNNTVPTEYVISSIPILPMANLPLPVSNLQIPLLPHMASSSATLQKLLSTVTNDLLVTEDTNQSEAQASNYPCLTSSPRIPNYSI